MWEQEVGAAKPLQAIAIRFDQLSEGYMSMLWLASTRYRIEFVHAV
jgi:hypothetical protein